MTDWADELADEALNGKGRILYGQELKDRIAEYLRKAKADGRDEVLQELGLRPGDSVTYGPTDPPTTT